MIKILILMLLSQIGFGQAAKIIRNKAQDQNIEIYVNDGGVDTKIIDLNSDGRFDISNGNLGFVGSSTVTNNITGTGASDPLTVEANGNINIRIDADNGSPGSRAFTVQGGGGTTRILYDDGTQKTELSVRDDSNCGIGNICSGSGTGGITATVDGATFTSILKFSFSWMRVGGNFHAAGNFPANWVTSQGGYIQFDLPSAIQPTSNWGDGNQCNGVASLEPNDPNNHNAWTGQCLSVSGTKDVRCHIENITESSGNRSLRFNFQCILN